MTTTPIYPGSAGAWEPYRVPLIEIAATGTVLQSQRAITLLARELTARWWCSVWDVNTGGGPHGVSSHFAFKALNVPPGEDPTAFVEGSDPPRRKYAHSTEQGAALARYFELYSPQGAVGSPGGYVQRMISGPLEDGTVHTYPAPHRSASIWGAVVAECAPLAAALIEEVEE